MTKSKITFLTISIVLMLSLLAGAVFGQATQKSSVYRYLSIFAEVFDLVRSNYVEPVNSDQLLDGAFSGVTDAIDEFSYYVPPAQMAAYKTFAESDDNGTGLIVTKRFGYAYVISSVPGSPAAKSGIERGDFIEKIEGNPTQKMSVWQVRNSLHSNKAVHLQILRGGQTKRDSFSITPAQYHPLAMTRRQIGSVAYIRIPYFEKGSAVRFREELESVRKAGVKKLIVDLRGNAGGDVEEAITAADELLTSGLITALEGRKVEAKKWTADRATAYDGELEVLTDNSTASGAEIFAAAVRGNGRGKVVGVTTYGKSVVQRFITLPSGGGVYMTVAHYTSPDQKPIREAGVRPDVLVDLSAESLRDDKGNKPQQVEDTILNKALSLFGESMQEMKKAA
jgi:carboxyl-terminal processing protease